MHYPTWIFMPIDPAVVLQLALHICCICDCRHQCTCVRHNNHVISIVITAICARVCQL